MKKAFKWIGIGLGVIVALLILLAGILYVVGSSKVNKTYEVELATLAISEDSASVARGAHFSRIYGCTDCHGGDLSGQVFIDAPPFRVTASNLTPGSGGIGHYSVEDLDRAIRHGVKPDGRSVVVMPSSAYHHLSDDDVADLIAYIKNLPPVDNEMPPTTIKAMGRIMAAGLLDPSIEVRTIRARSEPAPPKAPTSEYGAYLASVTCGHCHGGDLRGAQPPDPDSPFAPDLAAAGSWPLAQFKETLRTGVRPGGDEIDAMYMPISLTKAMDDTELEALYALLSTLASGEQTASNGE